MKKDYVSYREFGAAGDGVTNDYFAMMAAHDYANENGLPVKADPSDTYLIKNKERDGAARSIIIKTDTDWCGATIILDDSDTTWVPEKGDFNYNTNPFVVKSDYEPVTLPEEIAEKINARGGIKNNDLKKIETGLGYPAMLIIGNPEERVFIRFGGNANNGSGQQELIVVDKDGNIDPSTPFIFDYDKVAYIIAYRIDDKPITVENAKFISRASRVNLIDQYHYIDSGISVMRSNTTVRNLEHVITGEIDKYAVVDKDSNLLPGYTCDWNTHVVRDPEGREVTDGHAVGFIGHSYGAFLRANYANNVLFEKIIFQARVFYLQGTYDLGGRMSNNIVFKDCDQQNFFSNDRPDMPRYPGVGKWWGVGGTNFCKNMTYDGCRLTRFDAHCGLVNGKIINSDIAAITLMGAGDMLIENSRLYADSNRVVSLRPDYGSTWRGTITIRNSDIFDVCNSSKLEMIVSCLSANHNFGYPVSFPNVVIDNLRVENPRPMIKLVEDRRPEQNERFFFRSVYDPAITTLGAVCTDGRENVNVHNPPEFIKVINNGKNGYEIEIYESEFFKNTSTEGVVIKTRER